LKKLKEIACNDVLCYNMFGDEYGKGTAEKKINKVKKL